MTLAAEDGTMAFAYYAKKGITVIPACADKSDPANQREAFAVHYRLNGQPVFSMIFAKAGSPKLYRSLDTIVRQLKRKRK